MIYIENKDGVQRITIPTNDTNAEYVQFVPQPGDSDYYTKEQTDEKILQSNTAVLGEVGDWLSHYPTTDQMHDEITDAVQGIEPVVAPAYVIRLQDLRLYRKDIEAILEKDDIRPVIFVNTETVLNTSVQMPVTILHSPGIDGKKEILVWGILLNHMYSWVLYPSADSVTPDKKEIQYKEL